MARAVSVSMIECEVCGRQDSDPQVIAKCERDHALVSKFLELFNQVIGKPLDLTYSVNGHISQSLKELKIEEIRGIIDLGVKGPEEYFTFFLKLHFVREHFPEDAKYLVYANAYDATDEGYENLKKFVAGDDDLSLVLTDEGLDTSGRTSEFDRLAGIITIKVKK